MPAHKQPITDRELLELAAKVAGYKKYYAHYLGRDSFVTYDAEYYSEVKEQRVVGEKTLDWNPLTDDGDALRLAVKLGLTLNTPTPWFKGNADHLYCDASWWSFSASEQWSSVDIKLSEGGDPCAAMRRAIVRAAAEMGRDAK